MAESNETRGLSCSVCYNHFKSDEVQFVPRNLNCGHTYCTGKTLNNFLYVCFAHHIYGTTGIYLCSANRAKFDKIRINIMHTRSFISLLLPLCDISGYFCVHIILNWSMHFLKDVWTSLRFKHAILAQYVVQHAKQKQHCFQELLKVLGISPRTLECLKFLRAKKKFKQMAYRKRRKKISTYALNMMKLWKFIATQITASFASTVR